jgi:hypothetical protein
VHQSALAADGPAQGRTARDWRGKIVPHHDLHHERLLALTKTGYIFRLLLVEEAGRIPGVALDPSADQEVWPVLAVGANGQLSFFSPEHTLNVAPGDRVIVFQPPPDAARASATRRRFLNFLRREAA